MLGAIFDIDGTVLDSMTVWVNITNDFFAEHGVALSEEEIRTMEKISGQKYEETWLGKDNGADAPHIETNENGEYQILLDIEAEMAAIRTSKEK